MHASLLDAELPTSCISTPVPNGGVVRVVSSIICSKLKSRVGIELVRSVIAHERYNTSFSGTRDDNTITIVRSLVSSYLVLIPALYTGARCNNALLGGVARRSL